MIIQQAKVTKTTVLLTLSGRLDAANAPLLERKIKQVTIESIDLILDFAGLTYISSMGLRVLLHAMKTQKEAGRKLIIQNMNDSVREVFKITGFLKLMVLDEKFVVVRKDEPNSITLSFNGQMQMENITTVSKELSDIRECISRKPVTNEPGMPDESPADRSDTFTIVLDMEKLDYISPGAGKHLKQVIAETAWEKRTLVVRNAGGIVLEELENSGVIETD